MCLIWFKPHGMMERGNMAQEKKKQCQGAELMQVNKKLHF